MSAAWSVYWCLLAIAVCHGSGPVASPTRVTAPRAPADSVTTTTTTYVVALVQYRMLARHVERVSRVLCPSDVVVPSFSAVWTWTALRQQCPQLPVVALSPSRPCPPWQHVPRHNPAMAYPTDFVLMQLAAVPMARRLQLQRLRAATSVVASVTRQFHYHRVPLTSSRRRSAPPPSSATTKLDGASPRVPSARRTSAFAFGVPDAVAQLADADDGDGPSDRTSGDEAHFLPGALVNLTFAELMAHPLPHHRSRTLLWQARRESEHLAIAEQLRAPSLWSQGITGRGVRVAIFDTGLRPGHEHFRHIQDQTNWTDEPELSDKIGHGTFVAGVVASASAACPGLAPDAELWIFRVFTVKQLSFTAWFLDAFNYAIRHKVHVINLSIGGPDFMDKPFVRKVSELTANGILMVSAIGNDGPRYGTLNNPADQLEVLGVGGITASDRIATFSSRGMTAWEMPAGYGRVKPDVVTYARRLYGASPTGGCRLLSGTSVASPVVAGAVALLLQVLLAPDAALPSASKSATGASTLAFADTTIHLNPALLKQALMSTATRLPEPAPPRDYGVVARIRAEAATRFAGRDVSALPWTHTGAANIFEQGAGKINLVEAVHWLQHRDTTVVTAHPASLDLTDCPYMWPFCTQPLFWSARPLLVNISLMSSLSVTGFLDPSPVWTPTNDAASLLQVTFRYSPLLWPWSGYLGMAVQVRSDAATAITAATLAEGRVTIHVRVLDSRTFTLELPFKIELLPPPPRNMRIVFDQFRSLRYPSGYFPRDNLEIKSDMLDWNGDHVHTNYRELYLQLRARGYFVDVLGHDYSCFDASLYGTLLLIDPEEEFFPAELDKLYADVTQKGLSLVVLAEWYNTQIMHQLRFFDDNTRRWWTPVTGGANMPALNELLGKFGMAFGTKVYVGDISQGVVHTHYASGAALTAFPAHGTVVHVPLFETTGPGQKAGRMSPDVPILGWWDAKHATAAAATVLDEDLATSHKDHPQVPPATAGRVAVYGDSNCVDGSHMVAPCYDMILALLEYASHGRLDATQFPTARPVGATPFVDASQGRPVRPLPPASHQLGPGNQPLSFYSRVLTMTMPMCLTDAHAWHMKAGAEDPVPAVVAATNTTVATGLSATFKPVDAVATMIQNQIAARLRPSRATVPKTAAATTTTTTTTTTSSSFRMSATETFLTVDTPIVAVLTLWALLMLVALVACYARRRHRVSGEPSPSAQSTVVPVHLNNGAGGDVSASPKSSLSELAVRHVM